MSGTENVRRVVKVLASRGVDHIKILATERAGTADTDPRKRTFTDEELIAIVDEASKAGLKVAAHAHGDEGAYAAVNAGVWSIEHGTWLTDKTLDLMKAKGTWFVTNITGDSATVFWNSINSPDPILVERRRTMRPLAREVTRHAYKMGIHIAGASDFTYDIRFESGRATIADNAAGLAGARIPRMEAIKAITSQAAKLLRIDNRTGAIKKGLEADIVIVGSDPLSQPEALKDIRIIVNDGKIAFSKIDTNKTWGQKANASLSPTDSLYWINVSTDSGVVHAAVAMPEGVGPFPAIIILHGTHGFAQEYVQLAKRFAAKGFIGIAACWFAGRKGAGQRFITPIDFADAPPFLDVEAGRFRLARQTIDSLIEKVIALPKIQKGSLALMGHSRGAGACLDYMLTHPGRVQALVLNSCGYPPDVTKRAAEEINVPVLVLHGTENNPADGGSAFSNIEMARGFEAALKEANKDVEVKYYEGSGHNALFTDPSQFDDAVERASNFIRKKLKK